MTDEIDQPSKKPKLSSAEEITESNGNHRPANLETVSGAADGIEIDSDESKRIAFDPTPSRAIAAQAGPSTPVTKATPARHASTSRRTPASSRLDGESQYRGPDLEFFESHGTYKDSSRVQRNKNKAKSLRSQWVHGIYQPSDLAVVASTSTDVDPENEDQDFCKAHQTRFALPGLPWPKDGLVRTRLNHHAFEDLKLDRYQHWTHLAGWIPDSPIYDMGWWPGKPIGYKQCQERTDYVQEHRTAFDAEEPRRNNTIGWPFIHPALYQTRDSMQMLPSEIAKIYTQASQAAQQAPLRHPTTVIKPLRPNSELGIKLEVQSSRAAGKARMSIKMEEDGEAAAEGEEDEDDNEETTTNPTPNATRVSVDRNDPKFGGIKNLGFEEALPRTGQVLDISIGAPGQEVPSQMQRFTSQRLDGLGLKNNEGHILNVGGHVYDLDWAPIPIHLNEGKEYFAVSASSITLPQTYVGVKQQRPTPGSIQIWSVSPDSNESKNDGSNSEKKGQAKLEMVICHDLGPAWKLSWCPMGHDYLSTNGRHAVKDMHRLGLLAGCFADGSASIFSIPYPEQFESPRRGSEAATDKENPTQPIYIRLDPVLTLELPNTAANCLAWAGGELLAVGGTNGYVGVWNFGLMFRSAAPASLSAEIDVTPCHYFRAHRAPITSLSWILLPRIDADGVSHHSGLPTQIFSVSVDGWTCLIDLASQTPTVSSIERSRSNHYASAFVAHGMFLAHENGDGSLNMYSLRSEELSRSRLVSSTPARILSISTSPFHPIIACGTAHGEVKLCNALRATKRSGKQHAQRVHIPVFHQSLDRTTGELKMIHQLNAEMANTYDSKHWNQAAWNSLLNVTAVKWNPNLGRANLILSGTAAGIVKIDCVRSPF